MKARTPRPILSDLSNRFALTVPECAEVLGVNPNTVRKMMDAGELPRLKFGKSVRVAVEALKYYIRVNTVWPAHPDWARRVDEQAQEPTYGLHLVERSA